jgi:hypothetical protein
MKDDAAEQVREKVTGLLSYGPLYLPEQLHHIALSIRDQFPSSVLGGVDIHEVEAMVKNSLEDHRKESGLAAGRNLDQHQGDEFDWVRFDDDGYDQMQENRYPGDNSLSASPSQEAGNQKSDDLKVLARQKQLQSIAAHRLTEYLNGINGQVLKTGHRFRTSHFLALGDFSAELVLKLLRFKVFSYNESIIRGIMDDPVFYDMFDALKIRDKPQRNEAGTAGARHPLPFPDNTNEARQPIKDKGGPGREWFEKKDGKLYINFEHSWTSADGTSYRYHQLDEARAYDPLAQRSPLLWCEHDSHIV